MSFFAICSIDALPLIMYKNFANFLTLHVLSNHNNHNATVVSLYFKYRVILLRFYQFLLKYWISSSDYLFQENCSKMIILKRAILDSLFPCNFLIKINKIWTLSCYKIIIFFLFFKSTLFSFVPIWSRLCCVTMDSVIKV